jgi:hypothetical protein
VAERNAWSPWLFSFWRGLLFPLMLGGGVLATFYLIGSYRVAAHGEQSEAMWALAGGAVLVAISIPTALRAWRISDWSRGFRFFIVLTVAVGSIVATLSVFLMDLQGSTDGAAVWVTILVGLTAAVLWTLGFWISIIAMLRRAIRVGRDHRSQSTPDTSSC